MRKALLFLAIITFPIISLCQTLSELRPYDASDQNPFGLPNPSSPEEIKDFEPMLGLCNCKSINRNPDGTWQDTVQMLWKFQYILNGTAVQDESWKSDGSYSSSVRQFHPDSALWYVTYFSSKSIAPKPPTWAGKKIGDEIVLDLAQKAPNGMEGVSRLTFYDITKNGYNWKGEWVSADGSIIYPFWRIYCTRPNTP